MRLHHGTLKLHVTAHRSMRRSDTVNCSLNFLPLPSTVASNYRVSLNDRHTAKAHTISNVRRVLGNRSCTYRALAGPKSLLHFLHSLASFPFVQLTFSLLFFFTFSRASTFPHELYITCSLVSSVPSFFAFSLTAHGPHLSTQHSRLRPSMMLMMLLLPASQPKIPQALVRRCALGPNAGLLLLTEFTSRLR
jgi:hypothetical protein